MHCSDRHRLKMGKLFVNNRVITGYEGPVTVQVVQSDSVREVFEVGRDVGEDRTSGDSD